MAERLSSPTTLTGSPPEMSWSNASPSECAGSVLMTSVLYGRCRVRRLLLKTPPSPWVSHTSSLQNRSRMLFPHKDVLIDGRTQAVCV